jgi:DNA-binding MarR family transcriptional regulator
MSAYDPKRTLPSDLPVCGLTHYFLRAHECLPSTSFASTEQCRPAERFQHLQDSLKGIAPNTLSERLRTLEENGVLERRFYSMSRPRAEYVLTAKGRDLSPIVRAMRDWGRKYAR